MAVVERDVGRRPQHNEHAVAVDSEPLQHGGVGLEVREVVLLLQAGVPQQLRWSDAEACEALVGDRIGHDHLRRRTHAELVLQCRELVVVCCRTRYAEPSRGHGELVRAVRQREVEAARARPLPQFVQA